MQPRRYDNKPQPLTGYPSPPAANVEAAAAQNRDQWQPKYPDFAVSPTQGLNDVPSVGGTAWEAAPGSSHVDSWRLQGGGFVKKFYGPSVGAPKNTNYVLGVKFKPSGKSGRVKEYEYYFTSEADADHYIEAMRNAEHPGYIIQELIAAGVPYKRKYKRHYARGGSDRIYYVSGVDNQEGFKHFHPSYGRALLEEEANPPSRYQVFSKWFDDDTLHHLPGDYRYGNDHDWQYRWPYVVRHNLDNHTHQNFRPGDPGYQDTMAGRHVSDPRVMQWYEDFYHLAQLTSPKTTDPELFRHLEPFRTTAMLNDDLAPYFVMNDHLEESHAQHPQARAIIDGIAAIRDRSTKYRRRTKPRRYNEADLRRSIRDNPADASYRLVFADWLDENGRGQEAAYIRRHIDGLTAQGAEWQRQQAAQAAQVRQNAWRTARDARHRQLAMRVAEVYRRRFGVPARSDAADILYGGGGQQSEDWNRYSKSWHRKYGPSRYLNAGVRVVYPHQNARDGHIVIENHNGREVFRIGTREAPNWINPPIVQPPVDEQSPPPAPENLSRQPRRYATSEPLGGTGQSLAALTSANQQAEQAVLKEVLTKLGFGPKTYRIRDLLHDTPEQTQPGVGAWLDNPNDPAKARYTAAWHGLMASVPGQLIFHSDPEGQDRLYSMHLAGNAEDIKNTMNSFGLPQRHLLPTPQGFRVLVYDPKQTLRPLVQRFAEAHDADVYEHPGRGEYIGSAIAGVGADAIASAREQYRNITRAYESGGAAPGPDTANRTGAERVQASTGQGGSYPTLQLARSPARAAVSQPSRPQPGVSNGRLQKTQTARRQPYQQKAGGRACQARPQGQAQGRQKVVYARGGAEEAAHHAAMRDTSQADAALRYAEFLEEHGAPTQAAVIRDHVQYGHKIFVGTVPRIGGARYSRDDVAARHLPKPFFRVWPDDKAVGVFYPDLNDHKSVYYYLANQQGDLLGKVEGLLAEGVKPDGVEFGRFGMSEPRRLARLPINLEKRLIEPLATLGITPHDEMVKRNYLASTLAQYEDPRAMLVQHALHYTKPINRVKWLHSARLATTNFANKTVEDRGTLAFGHAAGGGPVVLWSPAPGKEYVATGMAAELHPNEAASLLHKMHEHDLLGTHDYMVMRKHLQAGYPQTVAEVPPQRFRRRYARFGAEEAAHHEAMATERGDPQPALRYAEFLEEHGLPTHAEVIRRHVADQPIYRPCSGDAGAIVFNKNPHIAGNWVDHFPGDPMKWVGLRISGLGNKDFRFWVAAPDDHKELVGRLIDEGVHPGDGMERMARRRRYEYHPDEARDATGRWTAGTTATPVASSPHPPKLRRAILSWLKKPIAVVQKAAQAAMTRIRSRYGPKVARAVKIAVIASQPIPLPMASLLVAAPIVAFAELKRQVRGPVRQARQYARGGAEEAAHHAALIEAIANGADHTEPRNRYADFLEEHGLINHALMVRGRTFSVSTPKRKRKDYFIANHGGNYYLNITSHPETGQKLLTFGENIEKPYRLNVLEGLLSEGANTGDIWTKHFLDAMRDGREPQPGEQRRRYADSGWAKTLPTNKLAPRPINAPPPLPTEEPSNAVDMQGLVAKIPMLQERTLDKMLHDHIANNPSTRSQQATAHQLFLHRDMVPGLMSTIGSQPPRVQEFLHGLPPAHPAIEANFKALYDWFKGVGYPVSALELTNALVRRHRTYADFAGRPRSQVYHDVGATGGPKPPVYTRKYARGGAEEQAHWAAINQRTVQLEPHLNYADFLEEHGSPTLASHIRATAYSHLRDWKDGPPHNWQGLSNAEMDPGQTWVWHAPADSSLPHAGSTFHVAGELLHGRKRLYTRIPIGGDAVMVHAHSYELPQLARLVHNLIAEGVKPAETSTTQDFLAAHPRKLARRKLARGGAEERAHHEAIAADFSNPEPALRYAEFLEEHGMPMHAYVIREHVKHKGNQEYWKPNAGGFDLVESYHYTPNYHIAWANNHVSWNGRDPRLPGVFHVGVSIPYLGAQHKDSDFRGNLVAISWSTNSEQPYSHEDANRIVDSLLAEGAAGDESLYSHGLKPHKLAARSPKGGWAQLTPFGILGYPGGEFLSKEATPKTYDSNSKDEAGDAAIVAEVLAALQEHIQQPKSYDAAIDAVYPSQKLGPHTKIKKLPNKKPKRHPLKMARGGAEEAAHHDAMLEDWDKNVDKPHSAMHYADWLEEQGLPAHAEAIRRSMQRTVNVKNPYRLRLIKPNYVYKGGAVGVSEHARVGDFLLNLAMPYVGNDESGIFARGSNSGDHFLFSPVLPMADAIDLGGRLVAEGVRPALRLREELARLKNPKLARRKYAMGGAEEAVHHAAILSKLAYGMGAKEPTLRYADFLEENGKPSLAAFLRLAWHPKRPLYLSEPVTLDELTMAREPKSVWLIHSSIAGYRPSNPTQKHLSLAINMQSLAHPETGEDAHDIEFHVPRKLLTKKMVNNLHAEGVKIARYIDEDKWEQDRYRHRGEPEEGIQSEPLQRRRYAATPAIPDHVRHDTSLVPDAHPDPLTYMSGFLGRPVTWEHLHALASHTPEADLRIKPWSDSLVTLSTEGRHGHSHRLIARDPGTGAVKLVNSSSIVWPSSPVRGYDVLHRQVQAAHALGIPKIGIDSALRSQIANGYYTWPRYGFNGRLWHDHVSALPPELSQQLRGDTSLHKLFDIPGGPEAWKEHGATLKNLEFDTNPASPHYQRLLAYIQSRRAREQGQGTAADTPTARPMSRHAQPRRLQSGLLASSGGTGQTGIVGQSAGLGNRGGGSGLSPDLLKLPEPIAIRRLGHLPPEQARLAYRTAQAHAQGPTLLDLWDAEGTAPDAQVSRLAAEFAIPSPVAQGLVDAHYKATTAAWTAAQALKANGLDHNVNIQTLAAQHNLDPVRARRIYYLQRRGAKAVMANKSIRDKVLSVASKLRKKVEEDGIAATDNYKQGSRVCSPPFCEHYSDALQSELKKIGVPAQVVKGKFTHNGKDIFHKWVEVDGKLIADVTADQFGEHLPPIVVAQYKDFPQYKKP